jgi:sodium/potassium/calcium exchanger 6
MLPAVVFSILIMFKTKVSHVNPTLLNIFAFFGFIMSLAWIQFTANIIVDLLIILGEIMAINNSILALTVLAWGNCITDLNANLAMCRRGYGEMAFTGCMAGPIFNILIGLGVSFIMKMISIGKDVDLMTFNSKDGKFNNEWIIPAGMTIAELISI